MSKPDLWVLTTAPGHRAAEALDLFTSLGTPPERRVVTTNPPDPITTFDGHLIVWPEIGVNISNWWTIGLDFIAGHYQEDEIWDVLLIETDARMTPEDVDTVRDHMRTLDVVMAGADWQNVLQGKPYHVRRDNSQWNPVGRMPGIGAVVAGEAGIRHDPEFRWWYADDDFEWQHRVNGGTVLVGGTTVRHQGTQGPLTGEREIAEREDRVKFEQKWNGGPWIGGVTETVLFDVR